MGQWCEELFLSLVCLSCAGVRVQSNRCNLYNASPRKLVERHEDAEDMGGYFVVNGLEKLIRLLIVNRRNYVMGISRPSFTKRGNFYTNFGTQIRCVRPDQSAQTITVHYLSDGDCTVRFSFRKREYMIPAVIVFKASLIASPFFFFLSSF